MVELTKVIQLLESWAPLSIQESYDNAGLIVGDKDRSISKVLIALDCTESIVEEAIEKGCQLIVAHHPIIFNGLKRLNGNNYVERTVIKAIKNDIAIYAIHTNLDIIKTGVNQKIADLIGLKNTEMLLPKSKMLKKIVTYIPEASFETVTSALFKIGCGHIGNYSKAGFAIKGSGTFMGNEYSSPVIGQKNQLEKIDEIRWESIFPEYIMNKVISTLKEYHPYEEVAYDIYSLDNVSNEYGLGMIGALEEPIDLTDFLPLIKDTFNCSSIKYTPISKKIKKIAVCGGAGASLINVAKAKGADAFITSDIKYHEFFEADGQLSLIDIGHYESEHCTKQIIFDYFKKNVVSLHLEISEISTNPINYFI